MLNALFYGIYLGVVGFTIPLVLPLYSFYYSVKDGRNIGTAVFLGSFSAYITAFIIILLNKKDFFVMPVFQTVLMVIMSVLNISVIIKLIFDFKNLKTEKDFLEKHKQQGENRDIYSSKSINYADITDLRKITGATVFFMSLLFSFTASEFIYWCSFSLYSEAIKLNGEIFPLVILFTVLIIVQWIVNILFSKFAVAIGKYIRPLMMRPFIIIVISLFASYTGYTIINVMKNFA